jgi:eukaryotic-like serine/threonine-protein kinase
MAPGDLVADRFAIERLAGAGGMGEVYRAHDRATGEAVALKVLGVKATDADAARFETEATVLAGLGHPGIVRYVAHGDARGQRYLAMEWLEGEDLSDRLLRGPLGVQEATSLGARVAEALGASHACGIVHRDLKPSNLFLPGGAIDTVKIIDFGIARRGWVAGATQVGMVVGTPGYMAPEQVQGKGQVDARADVFALGCVLYECLTGGPAFAGFELMALLVKILVEEVPPLRTRLPGAPAALEHLLARMLAKAPEARPGSGPALAAELRALAVDAARGAPDDATADATLTRGEQRVLCVVLVESALRTAGPIMDDATLATVEVSSGAWPALAETVIARGGQLRVLGDGAIAVTLAGTGLATDQAARAAGCALAVRRLLPERAIALATGRGEATGLRAGGEAIERAARMLVARHRARAVAHASGGAGEALPIDLDEVTAGLLDGHFIVAAGAAGLELQGARESAEPARTLLGKPTAFVGRDREMGVLEALFDECLGEPTARAALVTAAAGMGKSRLRHELTARVAARGEPAQVWAARGDPMGNLAAFNLVGQLVRQAAQLRDDEPIAARRQKLAARVGRFVGEADRARVTEFLGELVGTPFPAEHRVQLGAARQDPILMGDQMRRAWVDFVDAECKLTPLLLVLEDLHWGDAPSIELVDAALRVLADRPLFVLALGRPELHDAFPRLWAQRSVQEVRLGPLPRRASEQLIRDVLGAVPEAAVTRIRERSAGNAFFLEEILRATAEGRGDDVPETVLAMALSRLEHLEGDDRRLLRAASVFGDAFWRSGVARLLGVAPEALDARLDDLERREWIVRHGAAASRDEPQCAFRHALHREAAYGMLTADDRTLGHRLAGAWLEAAGEANADVLAGHFERGGEPLRAARFYQRAAEQALEGNDLAGAIDRVDRAVACGASGEALGALSLTRAVAHNWRGEHGEAERWAATALEMLPRDAARWYAAAESAAWAAGTRGDTARIEEIAAAMRAAHEGSGGGDGDAQRAVAVSNVAGWLMLSGAHDAAEALGAGLAGLLQRFPDDPEARAAIHAWLGMRALHAGDPSGFRRELERAAACTDEAGDQRRACLHRGNAAFVSAELGAYAEAAEIARHVAVDAKRMGLHVVATAAKINLGLTLSRLGDLGAARAMLEEALADLATQSNVREEGCCRLYLAAVLLRGGDLDAAEAEARCAIEALAGTMPLLPWARATLAAVLLARGRPAEALEHARQAHGELEAQGSVEEGEAVVRLAYAEALAANGDPAGAGAAIAAARDRLLARAATMDEAPARQSFLENVDENARTLALARAWIEDRRPT